MSPIIQPGTAGALQVGDTSRLTSSQFTKAEMNKSNSMACAVQVEANLQEELSVHLHFRKLNWSKYAMYLKSFHMLL